MTVSATVYFAVLACSAVAGVIAGLLLHRRIR